MELITLKEKEMPLLGRKRIHFELDYDKTATPKKEDIVKLISEKTKVNQELIHINHIYPKFGEHKAKVIVHIYKDIKNLNFVEKINKKPKKVKAAAESAPKAKVK